MNTNEDGVVIIHSLFDIKQALAEFVSPHDENVSKVSIDYKGTKLEADGNFDISKEFVNEFEVLKKRHEASTKLQATESPGKYFRPVSNVFNIEGRTRLDDFIERRLGGKRDGLRIRWDINEGVFYYDPFTKKLTKATK